MTLKDELTKQAVDITHNFFTALMSVETLQLFLPKQ
jgi:hypothetical protein